MILINQPYEENDNKDKSEVIETNILTNNCDENVCLMTVKIKSKKLKCT